MDAVHRLLTRLLDLVFAPLERLGVEWVILLSGAVFGVLALWAFKFISPQGAIRRAKDRIKGHLIEIRLYQDNLAVVTRAIGKVLWMNLRYLGLNFGPFVPLALPFALLAGQLVVRYAYDPIPLDPPGEPHLVGDGVTLKVMGASGAAWDPEFALSASEGLVAASPLVQSAEQRVAFQAFRPQSQGLHEWQIASAGETTVKQLWAGPPEVLGSPRVPLQPLRLTGWERLLWPAEPGLGDVPGLVRIEFSYPESRIGWLPGSGPIGVLMWFVIASLVAGFAAVKPLRVQI